MSVLSRIVYIVVGLAGVYCTTLLFATPAVTRTRDEYRRAA